METGSPVPSAVSWWHRDRADRTAPSKLPAYRWGTLAHCRLCAWSGCLGVYFCQWESKSNELSPEQWVCHTLFSRLLFLGAPSHPMLPSRVSAVPRLSAEPPCEPAARSPEATVAHKDAAGPPSPALELSSFKASPEMSGGGCL